jgi:phospholipid/cholesterol/gamma-HCH transport system permease protein
MSSQIPVSSGKIKVETASGGAVRIAVSGNWNVYEHPPDSTQAFKLLGTAARLELVAETLGKWDSSLVSLITRLTARANARNIPVERACLPDGLNNLVNLALAVPPRHDAAKKKRQTGILEILSSMALALPGTVTNILAFIGEVCMAFRRIITSQSTTDAADVWRCMKEAGADALPIVSVVSLLIGLILAFVGVIQLRMFGAEVYVSSLVVVGMSRIMGALMTGVVLSGRTGAAYAAIIGTMQVNEEVDALVTLGVPPVDNLVLPRVIALTLMTPVLVIYSVFMGVIGGFVVGSLILGIDPLEYYTYTMSFFKFSDLWVGLAHGLVFGTVIAVTGCYHGLRCGRSAEAVGNATTAAVVYSIIGIIISTALLTIFFNALKI